MMPFCNFFLTPDEKTLAELGISDPELVEQCQRDQGEGPLFFYVPVAGGAVRVGVCPEHAAYLEQLYGQEART